MPIFNDTFRPHIIRELNHRKSHWHRQEVTIPNVRVTALVRTGGGYVGGNIRLGQIHGFTLGVPDVSQVNTVNQLHNLDEQGSIIGITYLGRDKNDKKPFIFGIILQKNCWRHNGNTSVDQYKINY